LRRLAIRQARLEPLALSASSHERIVNGRSAASGEESIDLGKQSIPTTGLSPASPTALWAAEPDPTPPMTAHCSVCPHAHCWQRAVCGVVFPGVAKGGKSPWGYLW